jgi:ribonuclease HI/transposase InsO family protein
MYFDGSLTLRGAGAGVVLIAPTGEVLKYVVRLDFRATNNMAEYEGLLAGLRAAASLGIRRLLVKGDSQLVVNQVGKEYQCSDPMMAAYLAEVRKMERRFDGLELRHVLRRENQLADELARAASARAPLPVAAFEERLNIPTVSVPIRDEGKAPGATGTSEGAPLAGKPEEVRLSGDHSVVVTLEPATVAPWMGPIWAYLRDQVIPDDDASAEKIARLAKRYALVDGELYRRGTHGVLLRCISREEGSKLLSDIHEGVCGDHSSHRSLVGKAFRQGFYWPTALLDACELVKRCEACQFHAKQNHQPAQALQTIPLSWPFAVWGLDILGPFPRAAGGYEFLFVAIDKFTKWPEAEPVRKITAAAAVKFIRSIFVRFGVANRIITDNGTQFTSAPFQEFCDEMGTRICFASVAHPQSNGQVERANALILNGLKTRAFDRLHRCARQWVEELPAVLWSLRTTAGRATKETPFFLVYGAEAVLPSELSLGSARTRRYSEPEAEQSRMDDVNFIEEMRCRAALRAARYQQGLRRCHQRKVKGRSLAVGDLVLRRVQTRAGQNKLSPCWEGPFIVVGVPRPGCTRLATQEGLELPNPWNIEHLRKFYP